MPSDFIYQAKQNQPSRLLKKDLLILNMLQELRFSFLIFGKVDIKETILSSFFKHCYYAQYYNGVKTIADFLTHDLKHNRHNIRQRVIDLGLWEILTLLEMKKIGRGMDINPLILESLGFMNPVSDCLVPMIIDNLNYCSEEELYQIKKLAKVTPVIGITSRHEVIEMGIFYSYVEFSSAFFNKRLDVYFGGYNAN
jgi:hypothetical protein